MGLLVVGIVVFTTVVLLLVVIILLAKSKLVPSGQAQITINEDPSRSFSTPLGGKLLNVLADQKIFLSSACGGGGTCGQCLVKVEAGGGDILETELSHITKRQAKEGIRLSCQLSVKNDLKLAVPSEVFGCKQWTCQVISTRSVSTFIKELVLALPPGEENINFRAGGYIQIECEPHTVAFKDFEIDLQFHADWERAGYWSLVSHCHEKTVRAYSMANYPLEHGIIKLTIKIAVPSDVHKSKIPPGIMSSYLFSLKVGDPVVVSGPYGEFFAKETSNEMIYIGRGAGMAPLRSHIFDLLLRLKSGRRISYWFGGRDPKDLFYVDEFLALAQQYPNFTFHTSLSAPPTDGPYTGFKGRITDVLYENYLKNHRDLDNCEFYICGPPPMMDAMKSMLYDLGVEKENILYDDFGI